MQSAGENIYHTDANCHNLMRDIDGQAWILDFDPCDFRAGEKWKQGNLERLPRSFRKELRQGPGFQWNEDDWRQLLAGYALPTNPHERRRWHASLVATSRWFKAS